MNPRTLELLRRDCLKGGAETTETCKTHSSRGEMKDAV